MDNIVIGQYVKGDSWIYRMDPRVKIISLVLFIVITFLLPNLISVACLLGGLFLLILTTKIPVIKMLKGLKGLLFLLSFTFVIQIAYGRTGDLLVSLPMQFGLYNMLISVGLLLLFFLTVRFIPFKFIYFLIFALLSFVSQYYLKEQYLFGAYNIEIFQDGLERAGFVFLRVVIIVLISSLLTFSTSSTDLNNGLESVMKPLKVIKFPVSEMAMMLSITLRFIPTLLDETNKIMKSQASRGVDFKESKLKDKVTQIVSLLVPMFVISFQRAEDLANAMESRGYVIGAKRTKLDEMKIRFLDCMALFILFLGLGLAITINVI